MASSVNTSCTVLGLSKGQKYVFRVRAENKYGLSHPSKESQIIRLDDFLKESSSDEETDGKTEFNIVTLHYKSLTTYIFNAFQNVIFVFFFRSLYKPSLTRTNFEAPCGILDFLFFFRTQP